MYLQIQTNVCLQVVTVMRKQVNGYVLEIVVLVLCVLNPMHAVVPIRQAWEQTEPIHGWVVVQPKFEAER